jgi:hypothetical protein
VNISKGRAAIYRIGIELLDIGSPGNLIGDEVDARKTTRKEAVLRYISKKKNLGKRGFKCERRISWVGFGWIAVCYLVLALS